MCYLKNLVEEQDQFDFDHFLAKEEESSKEEPVNESVLMPCPEKHLTSSWSFDQQRLVNLFSMIQKNNAMISQLSKILGKNSQQHENSSIQNEQQNQDSTFESKSKAFSGKETENFEQNSHPLISKLFGPSHYKYRLEAVENIPETLYKERNFNLSVRLVDRQGKIVKNCNLINLCFSVCTQEGEWIVQNRVGQPFMKGKTESELLKGESEFRKLYPRDVSRCYPNGKVAMVVYCKPSTLVYSNPSAMESFVDYSEIEPLLIENVTIKAKKKE